MKVYVELEAIGECKEGVNCVFDISEFDLTITDYNGSDHRCSLLRPPFTS